MRHVLIALAIALVLPVCAPAREPLPAELMQAKTVYIEMGPFVPTKKKGDRGAQASYLGPCEKVLEKWGRLKIVSDPKQADIIIRISSEASESSAPVSTQYVSGSISVRQAMTSVDVVQASTGKTLWTNAGIWVAAFTAKMITKDLVVTLRKQVDRQERRDAKAAAETAAQP